MTALDVPGPLTADAVVYRRWGGPEVLEVEQREVPAPGPGEVRVRLQAAALNPVDFKIRAGGSRYGFPLPVTAGREFAGLIESVGEGVEGFGPGDPVFGGIPSGAFASVLIAPAEVIARVPDGVPWEVAAGIALAGQTAWDALASQNLRAGDRILVSAAAGGVGGILCQLALARGITVIGTAGTDNHAWLASLGVQPVLYGEGLLDRLRAFSAEPPTAVFDLHGPPTIQAALDWGVPPERINTNATDPTPFGVRGVGRGPVHPPTLDALAERVADGRLVIPVEARFPLVEARAAFERLEQGHLRGKVVLLA